MQLQADLLGCPVEVSAERETTALGVAALAGLALGVWPDTASLAKRFRRGTRYEPAGERNGIDELRAGWRLALRRALLH
jgi:glycerol kinase